MITMGTNGRYFGFDDDNQMSYKYILSITSIRIGQLNIYSPIYIAKKTATVMARSNYILGARLIYRTNIY